MAAVSPSVVEGVAVNGWKVVTYYGTGASNTDATLTTTAVAKHKVQKLCMVTVAYSGSPTQTGVTTTVDDGLGSGYDTLLNTGTANSKYTAYLPDGDVYLLPGDAIAVTALAGGSGQTAAIKVVVLEKAG